MKKHTLLKLLAMIVALCLPVCSLAESAVLKVADYEILYPLMDLVTLASYYTIDEPAPIPGAEGTLSTAFTDTFIKAGQIYGQQVGVTSDMMNDTNAQASLLKKVFAAQLPALETVVPAESTGRFIGFQAVTANAVGNELQIVGEIYTADKCIRDMNIAEYAGLQWLDRGIFTFTRDSGALNGYLLSGFSVGMELSMEDSFQSYFDEIVVEYVNNSLGFTVLYPAVFTDDMLEEDADGVSAVLPDGSVSFFAKRVANVNGASLQDYVGVIANGITGSVSTVNEELRCGTVSYITEDGRAVFDVYILTDRYIFQAELNYTTSLMGEYSMYNAYLQNSFVVDEVSVG